MTLNFVYLKEGRENLDNIFLKIENLLKCRIFTLYKVNNIFKKDEKKGLIARRHSMWKWFNKNKLIVYKY